MPMSSPFHFRRDSWIFNGLDGAASHRGVSFPLFLSKQQSEGRFARCFVCHFRSKIKA